MNLSGERLIPASVDRTWVALNDPGTLQSCIAGCRSLERTADDEFAAVMAVKIGPVNATFKGRLKLTNVLPMQSYTINFDGQGGVAGFGKGSADVSLQPDAGGTRLSYTAQAQVGGKIAQIGSRLVDAAAAKISEDFFTAFEKQVGAGAAAVPGIAESGPAAAETPRPDQAAAPPVPMPATPPGSRRLLWWAVAAAALALAAYLFKH